MSRYIDTEKFDCVVLEGKSLEFIEGVEFVLDKIDNTPTADVVDREQYNELYEENLKLREELNNLAGEELPWAIVTVCSRNKGESPYRYHCPHCGYSHKKPSHYCSNCGRRCKE